MTDNQLPRTRRHRTRPCLMCGVWLTRHPSQICRDCRHIVGDVVTRFSANMERNTP